MKMGDIVKVVHDNQFYNNAGIYKNMEGRILDAAIRDNNFLVIFIDPKFKDKTIIWTEELMDNVNDDIIIPIEIKDLELVQDEGTTDEELINDLPKNDPHWWCKVEDGYILNLKGEKKNKIAYDYDS